MLRDIDILKERVAERLSVVKLSPRKASLDATGSPDTIRYINDRDTMPSAAKLTNLAATLQTTTDYLLGRTDNPDPGSKPIVAPFSMPTRHNMARDLPVYGTALGADVELLTLTEEPVAVEQVELSMSSVIDYVMRPPLLIGRKDIFAVYVAGDSMAPRHYSGDAVLVDPSRPPAIGDDVLVMLKSPLDDGEAVTAALIKRLVRRTAKHVELEQFTPALTFKLDRPSIHAMYRIKPWAEAHGI